MSAKYKAESNFPTHADTQQKVAASQRVLPAGDLQR